MKILPVILVHDDVVLVFGGLALLCPASTLSSSHFLYSSQVPPPRRRSPPPVAAPDAAGRRHAAKPMQPKLVPGLDDDDGLTRPGAKRVRLWRDRTPEGAFPPSCLLLLPTVVPND